VGVGKEATMGRLEHWKSKFLKSLIWVAG
jgi:hypothetical protein